MLVCLLVGATGYAPDAGIVAEQARTFDALKAENAELNAKIADVNAKNAKLNAENAELNAEVATLKGAGAVATPRQLMFAAEPTSLANPPSRLTYNLWNDALGVIGLGSDDDDLPQDLPSLAWFPNTAERSSGLSYARSRTWQDLVVVQFADRSVRNYNTATGLTEDQCISNCLSGTWRGCVGFSRYTDQSTLDDDDNDEMTDGRTRASCWWVTRFSDGFIRDNNGARAPIPCPATAAS
jgi:hypothetical protein